jgi:hypothetical protein
MAMSYGLDGPRIESRWGTKYFAPVQTGSGAHPAYRKMGTESLSRGYSSPDVVFTTPSSAEV